MKFVSGVDVTVLHVAALVIASTFSALAADACDVPVVDWQPRETLKSQLESAGWSVTSITAKSGCYEATGTDNAGHVVVATFNPQTLAPVGQQHEIPNS
ncbi:hypothetical protein X737_34505 [Mesorhizobium sp. L48C026A00]|nr:hypothetical protein X737_34505 [Mesorhizobium sp. L48C026A00]